jgi:hypothetical protein
MSVQSGAAVISDADAPRRSRRQPKSQKKQIKRSKLYFLERSGKIFYCDYCDAFISTKRRTRQQHLQGAKHIEAVETYYAKLRREWPQLFTQTTPVVEAQASPASDAAHTTQTAANPL